MNKLNQVRDQVNNQIRECTRSQVKRQSGVVWCNTWDVEMLGDN